MPEDVKWITDQLERARADRRKVMARGSYWEGLKDEQESKGKGKVSKNTGRQLERALDDLYDIDEKIERLKGELEEQEEVEDAGEYQVNPGRAVNPIDIHAVISDDVMERQAAFGRQVTVVTLGLMTVLAIKLMHKWL